MTSAAPTAAAPASSQPASKKEGWKVSLGFVDITSNGASIKPQMQFGVESRNLNAGIGIGDVRNGLDVHMGAGASVRGRSHGRNFREAIKNLEMDSDVPKLGEFVAELTKFVVTNQADLLRLIARQCGLQLKPALESKTADITLEVSAGIIGIGTSAKLALGWENTDGFRMVGASGQATLGLTAGAAGFVGRHAREKRVKIVFSFLGFSAVLIVNLENAPEAIQVAAVAEAAPAAAEAAAESASKGGGPLQEGDGGSSAATSDAAATPAQGAGTNTWLPSFMRSGASG